MAGRESGREARLGGQMLLGAALVGAGTVGLEWRFAPSVLQSPWAEIPLVASGVLVLSTTLLSLALDRLEPIPAPPEPAGRGVASPQPSLMALPALVGKESAERYVPPVAAEDTGIDLPGLTDGPTSLAAEVASSSTLLIPFAGARSGATAATTPATSAPDTPPPFTPAESTSTQSVTRLVDRIGSLQRASPGGVPPEETHSTSQTGPPASPLLLRLARIPSPPTASAALEAARRCNDCGDPLGSPPHFEPCGDCGRALCERCYWRITTGPEAHLCAACIQDRAVPRPPVPALSFPRGAPAASVSSPSARPLPPRRPVN